MLSRFKQVDIPAIFILTIALFLRLIDLGIKPAHFDEGINGWFVDQMRGDGYYDYDPANYHGPFHFYSLFVSLNLFGRNLIALRLPAILASVLSVWCVLRFANVLPKSVCRIAALLMAVSPAYVFYGRYSIHESWLLLFLLFTLWGIFALWKTGSRSGLWATGLGVTGMILTKETYIIHVGCLLLAGATLRLIESIPLLGSWMQSKKMPTFGRALVFASEPFCLCSPGQPFARRKWDSLDLAWMLTVSILLLIFFYSGNFLNLGAVGRMFLTYGEWIHTGTGGGDPSAVVHKKDAIYWLELTEQLELPALLGLVACIRFVAPSHRYIRYLAIYGLGCLVAYSLITYKTPWCIIVILWPFYFLLAYLLVELAKFPWWSRLPWLEAGAVLALSVWQCVDLNLRKFVDPEHPYVYVQTFEEIEEITRPVLALARKDPIHYHIHGNVLVDSAFPIPWLLGDFTNLFYYTEKPKKTRPAQFDAAVLVVDENRIREVEAELRDSYYTKMVQVRNGMAPVKLYLRTTEFHELFSDCRADFVPKPIIIEDGVEVRRALPVR